MSLHLPAESRPDLAVGIEANVLGGAAKMLAPRLFPRFRVAERGGTIAAAKLSVGTGVKNRTQGQALTAGRDTAKDVTYAVDRYEGRTVLDDRDVKDHGGVEPAVAAAARVSAYAALKLHEQAAAALLFSATRYAAATSIVAATPFDAIARAAQSVKRYGRPKLVCSESWLSDFVKIEGVAKYLLELYGHGVIGGIVAGLPDALKAAGAAFGVTEVLVGDDDFWAVAGGSGGSAYDYTNAAAVVALRDDEMKADVVSTVKALPCYGFEPVFLPETDSTLDFPFEIETTFLPDAKDSAVDASLYAVPKEINGEAAKLVKLPAAQAGG